MTEGSSSSRDKPESKLNADRVSRQVSCFAILNKRIARDETRRNGKRERGGEGVEAKKKKKKDHRWPARRSGLSIPPGNTSSVARLITARDTREGVGRRRETNQETEERDRGKELLFASGGKKRKLVQGAGRIERIRENWSEGKIWKSYKQRREEEEEEEFVYYNSGRLERGWKATYPSPQPR